MSMRDWSRGERASAGGRERLREGRRERRERRDGVDEWVGGCEGGTEEECRWKGACMNRTAFSSSLLHDCRNRAQSARLGLPFFGARSVILCSALM